MRKQINAAAPPILDFYATNPNQYGFLNISVVSKIKVAPLLLRKRLYIKPLPHSRPSSVRYGRIKCGQLYTGGIYAGHSGISARIAPLWILPLLGENFLLFLFLHYALLCGLYSGKPSRVTWWSFYPLLLPLDYPRFATLCKNQ